MFYFSCEFLTRIFNRRVIMKFKILFLILTIVINLQADEASELFKTHCSACHTIGSGRLVGPDLKNINQQRDHEWLIKFIKSSQKLINSGDVEAVKIYNEYNKLLMPDPAISESQIEDVLTYIKQVSTGEIVLSDTISTIEEVFTPENITNGYMYFNGKLKLYGKGPTCLSCHKVKDDRAFPGGTLAKELTDTYKQMGSAGIKAILRNPPFPSMADSYKNNPLTDQEIIELTAYLKHVSDKSIYQHPRNFGPGFISWGLAFSFVFVSGLYLLFFNRKRKSVNHDILSRKSNVIN